MHKLESVRENEMHKVLWDYEIQTDHLISARRLKRVIINKEGWCSWNAYKKTREIRNKLKNRGYPEHNIMKID